MPVEAIIRSSPPRPSSPHLRASSSFTIKFSFNLLKTTTCYYQAIPSVNYFLSYNKQFSIKEMKVRLEGKARFRCPFFSPLACRHRSIASLHPAGWREASTANLSSLVCVRRLSRLRFLRHDKSKEGKQFTWMLSRLLMRV